ACSPMCVHAPISTLLPYTTLFRSRLAKRWLPLASAGAYAVLLVGLAAGECPLELLARAVLAPGAVFLGGSALRAALDRPRPYQRSEEHTSELQSRFDIVCRLLLEK